MAAVVAGGAVLPQLRLRVPSASSSAFEPVRRRRTPSVRCASVRGASRTAGRVEEDHYRTLRLARGEEGLPPPRAAVPHPDVVRRRGDGEDDGNNSVDFQQINLAYQRVMSNMREAETKLEYWRSRYGLADEDLDRYRRYLNDDEGEDDWFADL